VVSTPAGIDCAAAPCSATFPAGTAVALSVEPVPGRSLASFSGDCSGTACAVLLDRDRSVGVTYKARSYLISAAVRGPGSVAVAPAGPKRCRAVCRFSSLSGRGLTVTAHPDPGAVLAGWFGGCAPRGIRCSLKVTTGPTIFSARFVGVVLFDPVRHPDPRTLLLPGRASAVARLRMALLDRGGHVRLVRVAQVRQGRFSVRLPLPPLAAGSYTLRVSGDSNHRPLGPGERAVRLRG
jgi:hypothetical protein